MKLTDIHPRTWDINKNQKAASKKSRMQVLAWLAETFPKAFDTSVKIQPLKVGIDHDIHAYLATLSEQPFSKSKLREVLVMFSRRLDYLTSLKTRNIRIDLEGNPTGEVSKEAADKAIARIRKQIESATQRRRRSGAPHTQRTPHALPKATAMIKLKKRPQRSYDPDAVARLKEKLGLKKDEIEYT